MGMKYIRKKRALEMLIDDNPDLKNKPAQALVDAYERYLSQEEPETMPLKKDRLYAFDQSLDDDYYPDPD
jgi:hypothetical protein